MQHPTHAHRNPFAVLAHEEDEEEAAPIAANEPASPAPATDVAFAAEAATLPAGAGAAAPAGDKKFGDLPREASEAFKDELECIVCLETMFDPVTLECQHSLCRLCAVDHLESVRGRPRCALNCNLSTRIVPKVNTTLRNLIVATQPADELAARALAVRPRTATLEAREKALADGAKREEEGLLAAGREAEEHANAAYQQGVREGYRRERAAMTSFLQAEPGRRVLYFRDGAIRGAIKRDKRHKKTEKSDTLIAIAAAVASVGVLGLV